MKVAARRPAIRRWRARLDHPHHWDGVTVKRFSFPSAVPAWGHGLQIRHDCPPLNHAVACLVLKWDDGTPRVHLAEWLCGKSSMHPTFISEADPAHTCRRCQSRQQGQG